MRQQADPDDGRGCWEVTGELAGLEGGKARSAWCSRSSGRNRAPPEALGWKRSVPVTSLAEWVPPTHLG